MIPKTIQLGTARVTGQSDPEPGTGPGPSEPLSLEQIEDLGAKIKAVLGTCYDPEIPVNIYELGLVYHIDISPEGAVIIRMTLTSPACPVAGSLPGEVQRQVQAVPGVSAVAVELVWDPPWDKNRMSEAARVQLGIDDY